MEDPNLVPRMVGEVLALLIPIGIFWALVLASLRYHYRGKEGRG